MATVYPGALDEIAESVDGITPLNSAFFNDIIDPVNAIEDTLGINPQGNFPSVAARISSVVDQSGNAVISAGTINGVTIGNITPPNATLNNVTVIGELAGSFTVSTTYGSFSDLESRLNNYEDDGHGTVDDTTTISLSASSLGERLSQFGAVFLEIMGSDSSSWTDSPIATLTTLASSINTIEQPGFVTSVRIAAWDGTPANNPTVGSGIDVDMYRDASIYTSKIAVWDGSSGPTSLTGQGIANQQIKAQAVTYDKLDPNVVPIGATVLYPLPNQASTPPTGWLVTNGAALLQSAYPLLYAVIGTTFGNPGAGQFNLPNITTGITNYQYIIRATN